jgi:hypothetical protein
VKVAFGLTAYRILDHACHGRARNSGGAIGAPKDHPMPTANRFQARYSNQTHTRTCSTNGCSATSRNLSGRCHTCSGRLRRFGHPLQTLPSTAELDRYIRRIEEQVGRLRSLDIEALKARWEDVISECRARSTPSYKDRGTMSYNGWTREGAQMVRDVSEAVTFERVLGIVGAVHLLNLERQFFLSDEAFKCSMVELVRRTSRVGCKIVSMNNTNGTIGKSYRRELSRDSRLAAFDYLTAGVGLAALKLAEIERGRKAREQATKEAYHRTIAAMDGLHA